MKKIIFVTNTEGKVREAQDILGNGFRIEHKKLDLDEVQTVDGKEVIKKKAEEAYKLLGCAILVEDTSLYFDAWKGLPGALVRWFLDTVGCGGLCKMMRGETNRMAYSESAIAYYDGKNLKIVSGKIEGSVPDEPRGNKGFGWDPVFVPSGSERTFGELEMSEKNRISSRKIALEKLREYLFTT